MLEIATQANPDGDVAIIMGQTTLDLSRNKSLGKESTKGALESEEVKHKKVNNTSCLDVNDLYAKADNFVAGKIAKHLQAWKSITSDKFIIDIILHGLQLNLDMLPKYTHPYDYKRSPEEISIINTELVKLQKKYVIELTTHEQGTNFLQSLQELKKMVIKE